MPGAWQEFGRSGRAFRAGDDAAGPLSVVVNTYDRSASLAETLEALTLLDHPRFEVVIVNGPSTDGTERVLAGWEGRIKLVRTAERNLAHSRNLGVAAAAGAIVAFIDDDAYPDPAWLDHIASAYDDEEVAGAGGPVYDHNGFRLQAQYNVTNRLGTSWSLGRGQPNPTAAVSSPYTSVFASPIGTNASFRRDRLIEIGGFDEEFEYYLEETDVALRLIGQGFVVRALDHGHVYHKFLASHSRNAKRALRDRYSVIKSRAYFACKHGPPAFSPAEIGRDLEGFVKAQREDYLWCVREGLLETADFQSFERDIPRALDAGFAARQRGVERTRPPVWFAARAQPFLPFRTRRPAGRKMRLCFFSQQYPPGTVGGIARFTRELALGLAERGHDVHVLTRGEQETHVDLEQGVWVHRVRVERFARPEAPVVPEGIWDYAASVYEEALRLHRDRRLDLISAPLWDSEGIAALLDQRLPVVVSLHTPLPTALRTSPELRGSAEHDERWVRPLVRLEKFCLERCRAVLANSAAVADEVERVHGVLVRGGNCQVIAHGVGEAPHGVGGARSFVAPARPMPSVALLFVGRLERRKGIDVLLAALPDLLARFADVTLTVAGDDRLPNGAGTTYRREFERRAAGAVAERVRFLGHVSEDELEALYDASDIVVVPSRYESFGLVLVEAMRHGKPVVASDCGGMAEVLEAGETGLLVPPDDPAALAGALAVLIERPELRAEMGGRAASAYRARFTRAAMAQGVERFYAAVAGGRLAGAHVVEASLA